MGLTVPVNVPNHRYFFFKVFVFPESFDWELLPKKITPSRHLNLLNLKKNPVFLSVRTGLNKLYFIQEVSIQALINNLFSHSSIHFLIFRLEENKFILTKYFVSLSWSCRFKTINHTRKEISKAWLTITSITRHLRINDVKLYRN